MVGHPSSTFSRVFGPDSYRMRRDPGCDPGAIGLVYCDKLSAMYRPSCWRVLLLAPLSCAAFGQPPKLPTTASTVALAADASISASTSGAAAEVLAFERAMEAAVARGDVAYVDRVSASDLSFTHGDGWTNGGKPLSIDDRKAFLRRVENRQYNVRDLDSV